MDYKRIYFLLIIKAKLENTHNNIYYETHHILPRCLGGNDNYTNLVKMTPEQHYIAHQLLIKIYPDNSNLIYACRMMCMTKIGNDLGSRTNNKLYGWIKRKISQHMRDLHRNRFAIKNGFLDYDDQSKAIWYEYTNNISTKDISMKYNISLQNVCSSLKYYAESNNMQDILRKFRSINQASNSKRIRNNFTVEQENKRKLSCSKIDWKIVHYKQKLLRKGGNNPAAVKVIIDGKEFNSIKEAAFALNIDYWICVKRINSDDYPTYIRKKEK